MSGLSRDHGGAEKTSILYVDDGAANLALFQAMFEGEFEVFVASSGKEGLDVLGQNKISLVISDQRMPQMSGVEFLGRVLEEFPNSVRMIRTEFEDLDVVIEAINRGHIYHYFLHAWDHDEMAAVFRRASDDVRMAEKMRRAEERIRRQHNLQSVNTLAAGVAHEINNPINSIMNYAELILDDLEEGTEAHEFGRQIIEESQRVARMVANLLSFSDADLEERAVVPFAEIIRSTLALMTTALEKDQIQLVVEAPEDLPAIHANRHELQKILMTLVTNGRDALNSRFAGPHRDKILTVRAERVEDSVLITVEDRGSGVPAEIVDRVFDPFFTTKDVGKGTGPGLSIVRRIVLDHGGTISIEPRADPGTRVVIRLPTDEPLASDL